MNNVMLLDALHTVRGQSGNNQTFLFHQGNIASNHDKVMQKIIKPIYEAMKAHHSTDAIANLFRVIRNNMDKATNTIVEYIVDTIQPVLPTQKIEHEKEGDMYHMVRYMMRKAWDINFFTSFKGSYDGLYHIAGQWGKRIYDLDRQEESIFRRLCMSIELYNPLIQMGSDWGQTCGFRKDCHISWQAIDTNANVMVLFPAIYLAKVNGQDQVTICKAIVVKV